MPDNVVLLHAHDTGRHVSPYGFDVPTPNLDAFAAESLRFRNAQSPAPTCSPSRAAMTTGLAPHATGMTGLVNRGWSMDVPERHLANVLRRAGYDTVLPGFQHEHGGPNAEEELGYRTFPGPAGTPDSDEATVDAAVEYLRDPDDPFYMSVAFFNTHRPFPDPGDRDVDPESVRPFDPLPDEPPVRRDTAGYHAAASILDERVGRVLDALRAQGLLDDTLVVFTTDHGPPFPRMKCTLTDDGTRVALLARFPDGPRGETTDELVSHTDFVPTLTEYLGLDAPGETHGESWLDAVDDPDGFEGRDAVCSEVTYHAAYEPKRSVRTERYRYVRRYGEYDEVVLPNVDDGPSKTFLCDHGLGDREPPREALYDLYHDPNARDNRVGDPGYAGVLSDLRERLDDWMARTDDPLRGGPVSPPPGAEVTPQDCVHPEGRDDSTDGTK